MNQKKQFGELCYNMRTSFHKRNLPHIQPLGGTFFVTYNLAGSIPREVLDKWKAEYDEEKTKIMQFSKDIENDLERFGKLDFAKRDKFLDTYMYLIQGYTLFYFANKFVKKTGFIVSTFPEAKEKLKELIENS